MKKLLSDKRLKYGAYSTLITMVIIAILIVLNLVIGQFDRTFDLTAKQTYALSDETKSVLDNLNEDVNVYTLFSSSADNNMGVIDKIQQVVNEYTEKTSKIKLSNTDLYLHPDFVKKYANENTSVNVNSIIVECGDRYKVIDYNDYYIQASGVKEQINIESELTSAIQYVTNGTSSKIYFINGHGEADYSHFTTLNDRLKLSHYDVESISILDKDIPKDCTALFITPGERDFSAEEAEKIKNYLADDGRAFFLLGGTDTVNFKNIMGVINAYGVTLQNGYVLEAQQDKYFKYPYAIFPEISDNEINNGFEGRPYGVASQAVTELDIKKAGLKIEPLLSSSADSYVKNENNTSPNKEKDDISGPFNIVSAITDDSYTDKSHSTKIVVCGLSYYFIDPSYDSMVVNANSAFVVSAINWLNDKSDGVVISPKEFYSDTVLIDESSVNTIKLVGWIIIPGFLFVAGFVIWLIRRNK